MVLYFALFAGLIVANSRADSPPPPDFVAMIPSASENFFALLRDRSDPVRQEAAALAECLNRAWDSEEVRNDSDTCALYLLTAIQQFDSALMELNPNPTAGAALERVLAYRPVLALVRQQIEKDGTKPERTNVGNFPQLPRQLRAMERRIERQYYPLLARVV